MIGRTCVLVGGTRTRELETDFRGNMVVALGGFDDHRSTAPADKF